MKYLYEPYCDCCILYDRDGTFVAHVPCRRHSWTLRFKRGQSMSTYSVRGIDADAVQAELADKSL